MDSQEQTHYVKRVKLPSGRTIEVVYFHDPEAPEAPRVDDAGAGLHVCPGCDSGLVQPHQWAEAGPDSWTVSLHCPNCGLERSGVYAQDDVDAFDELLDKGCDELARDYRRLVRSNMEAEVERFATALLQDHILPEDF
jgi:hypothetical protein